MTGPLDGPREGPLVLRAVSGDASADDLSLLGQETGEAFDFFVIDRGDLVGAEAADLLAEKSGAAAPLPVGTTFPSLAAPTGATTRGFRSHVQKGTSSSGDNSSFEISIGPCFFAETPEGSSIGSSGSWTVSAAGSVLAPPRFRN